MTRSFWRTPDLGLALVLLAALAILIVPLPPPVLDALFAANLAAAMTLLVAVVLLPEPMRFASFPTLLVAGTLIRVSLGVAATRAILSHGDAGRVVHGFGSVVASSALIGLVLFAIIIVVQLLVVTRGAERVAEVAARFSLDALPGRQAALEADAKAGALSRQEASHARAALQRESQLYGAMDGAMKFVKGDAIAGLVIVVINLTAGLALGIVSRGLTFAEAAQSIAILSIGEGLLSAIPSLCVAVAAGLWVTRAANTSGLSVGADVMQSIFASHHALAIAAGLVAFLAFVPGLPAWPFAVAALGLGAAAWQRRQAVHVDEPMLELVIATSQLAAASTAELAAERASLLHLVGDQVPLLRWKGIADHPADRLTAHYQQRAIAWTSVNGSDSASLTEAARTALRLAAPELITPDAVAARLATLGTTAPRLVRDTIPARSSLLEVTTLGKTLVREGVPFDLLAVLRALASVSGTSPSYESVRAALRDTITAHFAPHGQLDVCAVDPMIEDALRDGMLTRGGVTTLALPPDLAKEVIDSVRNATATHAAVVLTSADVRHSLQSLLSEELPHVAVLSPAELAPGVAVTARQTIGG